jgi:hypothetical protein
LIVLGGTRALLRLALCAAASGRSPGALTALRSGPA